MLQMTVENDSLHFGAGFAISFQRTLRIPDDGKAYPLPPGLGRFPIQRVADFADKLPEAWVKQGGVFIPMYQREAMWLSFHAREWHPNVVKVGLGSINAVSGQPWQTRLSVEAGDYLTCPPQKWLDGINAGKEVVRQFVAMPLGRGYSVEEQLAGTSEGTLRLVVYEAKPGRFPDENPRPAVRGFSGVFALASSFAASKSSEMGLGAGGQMEQKLYPDPHGLDTWDAENSVEVIVHILNSAAYKRVTGQEAPATPVDAALYTQHGFPWFALYDEHLADIAAPENLAGVPSVKAVDATHGLVAHDPTLDVPDSQIVHYEMPDTDALTHDDMSDLDGV